MTLANLVEAVTPTNSALLAVIVPALPENLGAALQVARSEEHTSELQSRQYLVCRLLLEKKKNNIAVINQTLFCPSYIYHHLCLPSSVCFSSSDTKPEFQPCQYLVCRLLLQTNNNLFDTM